MEFWTDTYWIYYVGKGNIFMYIIGQFYPVLVIFPKKFTSLEIETQKIKYDESYHHNYPLGSNSQNGGVTSVSDLRKSYLWGHNRMLKLHNLTNKCMNSICFEIFWFMGSFPALATKRCWVMVIGKSIRCVFFKI